MMNIAIRPISILQISDLHILPKSGETLLGIDTEYYFQQVLKAAHQHYGQFDLILITGDLAQDPCVDSYQRIYKQLANYQTHTVCLPGNHDDYSLMTTILNQGLMNCDKQTLLKNWQLICLNSQKLHCEGGLLAKQELDFLAKSLQYNQKPYVMIAVHHHCIPCGSEWLDNMIIENSTELFNCLAPYPEVKLIITGHIHQAIETEHQGITILSTPATCFQFKADCQNFTLDPITSGYRVIQLSNQGQLTTHVHRLAGVQAELENCCEGYL
jgi:Icc protein